MTTLSRTVCRFEYIRSFTDICSYGILRSQNISRKRLGNTYRSCCTVETLQQKWSKRFRTKSIPEPEESSSYIIGHVIGKQMVKDGDHTVELTEHQMKQVDLLCEKRLQRMPVQYIIKEWDFHDLTLKMKPPVFIPRPETEELAEHAKEVLIKSIEDSGRPGKFLDLGSGSGAICLYILKSLQDKFKQVEGMAVDILSEACKLTAKNSEILLLKKKLKILHGDYTDEDTIKLLKTDGPYDMIVANPPYIPSAVANNLAAEITDFESRRAYDGGQTGLDFIHVILSIAGDLLYPDCCLLMEVDLTHIEKIEEFVESHTECRLKYVKAITDFTGRYRFVLLQKVP